MDRESKGRDFEWPTNWHKQIKPTEIGPIDHAAAELTFNDDLPIDLAFTIRHNLSRLGDLLKPVIDDAGLSINMVRSFDKSMLQEVAIDFRHDDDGSCVVVYANARTAELTEVTYLNDDEPQRADVALSHMAFAIRHHGSRGAHASGSGRGRE